MDPAHGQPKSFDEVSRYFDRAAALTEHPLGQIEPIKVCNSVEINWYSVWREPSRLGAAIRFIRNLRNEKMGVNEKHIVFLKATILVAAGLATILFSGLTAFGQTGEEQTVTLAPVMTEYKSIKIGTTANEVRDKLGKAEIDDKDGFYYRFSDKEFVQIRLDKDNKVRVISVTYSGEKAPMLTDVFGAGTKPEAKPDGSIYKLVRYPTAGYWVAYSRTAGEKPTVTITIQKLMT